MPRLVARHHRDDSETPFSRRASASCGNSSSGPPLDDKTLAMRSASRRPMPVDRDAWAASRKSSCGTASPVVNARSTRCCCSGAMPGPVSATARHTSSSPSCVGDPWPSGTTWQCTKTFPVVVNFAALDSKFVMNWINRTWSVRTSNSPGGGASTTSSTPPWRRGPWSFAALAHNAPKSTTSSFGVYMPFSILATSNMSLSVLTACWQTSR
mmetsp:Transcript_22259/g.68704  ORF Transcript_22259/g.68704 Transcript_22259/m.68704 type:complete len:211 (-) Transcript_22259:297-929(-)